MGIAIASSNGHGGVLPGVATAPEEIAQNAARNQATNRPSTQDERSGCLDMADLL
jgi:hypothetical protein